ncbi:MAG: glycosyltransferase [Bacilli bacterium]|nr:glycosyltransferase [Bacilli bacterium]
MKVSFYSNFLNHHQLPFCLEMQKILGEDFTFVATTSIEVERIKMGYEDMNNKYPFVVRPYGDEGSLEKAKDLALSSDVTIFGDCPNEYLNIRATCNKLSFIYSERIFKDGSLTRFLPNVKKSIYDNFLKFKNYNYYILSSSAYLPYDLDLSGFPKDKYLKWGYFPEVKKQDLSNLFLKKESSKPKILWVGRLIDWKKTIDAIKIAQKLRNNNYDFSLDIIGIGKEEEKLKNFVLKNHLNDCINFLGSMSPEKVREHMEKSNVFLFTSNFKEGWGAVLNEAMNSGCAVVASHAIGAVPFLLKNGENGLIYKFNNQKDFYNKVKYLLDNPNKQKEFGEKAYNTMDEMWNAEVAAQRFVELSKKLLKGEPLSFYDDGPLSKAEIIKNKWI